MTRIRAVLLTPILALAFVVSSLTLALPAEAKPGACPNTKEGRAVVAAIHRYWPKSQWRKAEQVAYKETGCGMRGPWYNCGYLCVKRKSTRDISYGPFMVNFHSSGGGCNKQIGICPRGAASIDGGTRIAYKMWVYCKGWGPWTKPYSCRR